MDALVKVCGPSTQSKDRKEIGDKYDQITLNKQCKNTLDDR